MVLFTIKGDAFRPRSDTVLPVVTYNTEIKKNIDLCFQIPDKSVLIIYTIQLLQRHLLLSFCFMFFLVLIDFQMLFRHQMGGCRFSSKFTWLIAKYHTSLPTIFFLNYNILHKKSNVIEYVVLINEIAIFFQFYSSLLFLLWIWWEFSFCLNRAVNFYRRIKWKINLVGI